MKKLRWIAETALFLGLSCLVAWLPAGVSLSFGKWLGRTFFRLLKRRREIAIENITASLPFLERHPEWIRRSPYQLALETFENLGCSAVEVCRLYHGRGQRLIEAVEFRGGENFERAAARGKGVALLTGHCGNWELMALAFGTRFRNFTVVAKPQGNPYLNAVLEKVRRRHGNTVLYRSGALRAMLSIFRKNGVVGLLIDQAASRTDGVLIDFLGRPAWTTNMLALLARRNQVPIVPGFAHREGEKLVVEIHPELDFGPGGSDVDDTVHVTRCIEEYVVRYPTEWYWIHQRWKRAPQPDDGPASERDGKRR